ncbi:MAG: NUDIX domain-containing protein [Candidatus Pacearchaeota archaeon]
MKYEESAGAILFYLENREPKFLLLKYPTYWGFAKGLIEKGEEAEETARREVEEETGFKNIEILPDFKFVQEWFYRFDGELIKKKAIFFLAKVKKEEADKVKLSLEHEAFSWDSYEQAIEKMKIKNNREMLTKAYEFIKQEGKQKKLV